MYLKRTSISTNLLLRYRFTLPALIFRFSFSFILVSICITFYYTLIRPAGGSRNFCDKSKEEREGALQFITAYFTFYWPI